jgi:hypothetical protein
MNTRNSFLWTCVLAAGSATAHADIFTWFINSGMWEDPAMWNGPAGQYPDSILDTATVSGSQTSATLSQNLTLGTLNILNGANVYSANNAVFVNGDTIINGQGSGLSATQSANINDLDTDTLTINEGVLAVYDGATVQLDEALIIENNGAVLGSGIIQMNSTTGHLVLDNGVLWALNGSGSGDGLHITRTESSTTKLDWTSPESGIIVWDAKTIHNELPYSGSLGGKLLVSNYGEGETRFESDHGFIGAASSEVAFGGDDLNTPNVIAAPFVDSYGEFSISGRGVLETSLLAMRGTMDISDNAQFSTNAGLINLHSFEITGGENSIFRTHANSSGIINIVDGATTVIMGVGSKFDLDGSDGSSTINIADNSSLWLEAEILDAAIPTSFDGTLNIDGSLHLEPVNGENFLSNNGEINLDSGALTGRGISNTGIIRGKGAVEGYTVNDGEIIADGGTLQFGSVSMDGDTGTGILRAQTGDLVMNMQSNGGNQHFTGSIFVGDGVGVREVLNADVNLWVRDINGNRGALELNSGFVAIHDFHTSGDMVVDGESLIRVTGTNGEDRISFSSGSMTTINGTLEADGNTWFVEGAQVNGSGTLDIVSTLKGIYFQDGADLVDVSLISSGGVYLTDIFDSHAAVHALTLRGTASLNISMWYSQVEGQILSDKLTVNDHAILDGDLVLANFPQTDLPAGQALTILEATSIEGEFDSINYSELGPNRRAFVTITDTAVEVFVTCFADLNADGQANFFDASAFMELFNQEDPFADLNEDGKLDFFDVSAFLSAYELGC